MSRTEKYPQLRWLVPTIVFLLIFIMAARTPVDSDMWWQMKSGEITINQLQPLTWDVFTHTVTGKLWTNHAWLGQVLMFAIYRVFSFAGLAGLMGVAAGASMILVYFQMNCPYFFRAFVLIAFSLVAAPVWTPRPQLISLFLFALLSLIIYLFRIDRKNYLYLLPVLFIIWANTHGGYTLGFILLIAVFLGEGINWLLDFGKKSEPQSRAIATGGFAHPTRTILIWTLVSAVAVLINANGLRIYTIPFETIGIRVLQDFIPEWASPDFHSIVEQPFIYLLVGTLLAIGLSGKQMDGVEAITLGLFTAMALLARRNFGPFAIVTAPIFGKYGWLLLVRIKPVFNHAEQKLFHRRKIPDQDSVEIPRAVQLILNGLLLFIFSCAALLKVLYVSSPEIMIRATENIYPNGAVSWLQKNQPSGNLFNDYNWGGYLIWFLPEYPVFVDGRTDLFGNDFLQEYLDTYSAVQGWQSRLDKYAVKTVMVPGSSPLAASLGTSPNWEKSYEDAISVVFTKRQSQLH